MYASSFDFPEVENAAKYRFIAKVSDGKDYATIMRYEKAKDKCLKQRICRLQH